MGTGWLNVISDEIRAKHHEVQTPWGPRYIQRINHVVAQCEYIPGPPVGPGP